MNESWTKWAVWGWAWAEPLHNTLQWSLEDTHTITHTRCLWTSVGPGMCPHSHTVLSELPMLWHFFLYLISSNETQDNSNNIINHITFTDSEEKMTQSLYDFMNASNIDIRLLLLVFIFYYMYNPSVESVALCGLWDGVKQSYIKCHHLLPWLQMKDWRN